MVYSYLYHLHEELLKELGKFKMKSYRTPIVRKRQYLLTQMGRTC